MQRDCFVTMEYFLNPFTVYVRGGQQVDRRVSVGRSRLICIDLTRYCTYKEHFNLCSRKYMFTYIFGAFCDG